MQGSDRRERDVGEGRSIGRASVLRHIGRARVGRPRRADVDKAQSGRPADVDQAAAVDHPNSEPPAQSPVPARGLVRVPPVLTNIMTGPQPPVPVFVDDSGRRRRRLRALTLGVALLLVVTGFIVWLSQSAAPVRPDPASTCAPGTTTAVCRQP